MDPYSPPAHDQLGPGVTAGQEGDDIAATQAPTLVKAAGATLAATSLITAAAALQLWALYGNLRLLGTIALVLLLGSATTGMVSALGLLRVKKWAILGAVVAAGVLTLVNLAWCVLSVLGGLFTLLAPMALLASVVAVVLAPMAMSGARRAADARGRLAQSGLDMGL